MTIISDEPACELRAQLERSLALCDRLGLSLAAARLEHVLDALPALPSGRIH